ncbi:MAG: EscU/YscU/HrcU family type III secretion system export apparatus switch protein [Candidatus Thiodiazotropha endolucinida]|nr:MAG: FhlB domain-containing protein [gamma proteobacterium symbiont of Ctena orbiculata]PUB91279.1 MAG: FhlB domain-containing protein [gamma proteobacterium symbiont of Ctena orbiculata]
MADDGPNKVVGLKYEPDQGLPRVILKGGGKLAEEIIAAGERMDGPPLVKDERLLEALYRLPVDGEIGQELFELVAALLVHVFAIDELAKE